MKLTFGIDIDGCLYRWEKTARYLLREVLPDSPYTKDGALGFESTDWNYIERNVSAPHWRWLWTEGVQLGLFRHGHLYSGAVKYVRALADVGNVIVITHRPQSAVHDTLAWLAFHQLPLAGIHVLTSQQPKSSVKPECDVYLDDKPENCTDLNVNTQGRVFLMDRPWNSRYCLLGAGIQRVYDWQDFFEKATA